MQIEQIQPFSGHQRIDTPVQYAMGKQINVETALRKYIGLNSVITNLDNIPSFQKGFAFKSKDYMRKGIKIIRVTNLNKRDFEDEHCIFLDDEKAKEYMKYAIPFCHALCLANLIFLRCSYD